jgi:hypothetical protein
MKIAIQIIIVVLSVMCFVSKAQTITLKKSRFEVFAFVTGDVPPSNIKHIFRKIKLNSGSSKFADYYISANNCLYYQPGRSVKIYIVANKDLKEVFLF